MALLRRQLAAPTLRHRLRRLVEAPEDARVRSVALAESLEGLGEVPHEAAVVLTETASQAATSYRLDMALRLAGSRSAAALVLTDGRESLPPTATTIAERAGLAVLSVPTSTDLAGLVVALQRELMGPPQAALLRIREAMAVIVEAPGTGAGSEELLAIASAALGAPLALREPGPGDIATVVLVDGEPEGAVCAPHGSEFGDVATEVVVRLTAEALGRLRSAARRATDIPIRSRAELLTEFMLAPVARGDRLLERMRTASLAVDGWHSVVRLEFENLATLTPEDELASVRVSDRIGRIALEAAHAAGGVWHRANDGSAMLLVRMERHDPGLRGARELTRAGTLILQRIASRVPDLVVLCGVGSTHVGATGLRASAGEARAAVAAGRATRRVNVPVSFDEVGLQRTLMDWWASDAARDAVDSLLGPLDALGEAKRRAALETLRSYLDNESSVSRTGKELHMHRNAVAYRVKRIFELLQVDPDDADTRLMLQLACRARSLG